MGYCSFIADLIFRIEFEEQLPDLEKEQGVFLITYLSVLAYPACKAFKSAKTCSACPAALTLRYSLTNWSL